METLLFIESIKKTKCGRKRAKVIEIYGGPERGEIKPERNHKKTSREIFTFFSEQRIRADLFFLCNVVVMP